MSVSRRHLTVAIAAALLVLAAFGAVAFGWSNDAVAQTRDALVRQEQYQCLKKQFPGVSTVDGKTAFDPDSGRNFAYEGNAWIDTKTLAPICSATPALVGRALYKCLKKQFPGVSTVDGKTAFDPDSGRNFAREGDSWIDTKTLESICPKVPATRTATGPAAPATPQVGMVIEPKISVGGGSSSSTATYDSTGGQPPFGSDASNGDAQLCGGATFYPGFVVGPARVGLDVNVCSGSSGTLFRIPRHGPGDVDLHASTNVIIDVLFKGEVPVGPSNNWFLSAGVGPSFRDLDLTLTSDQSFFGGGVPSISEANWQAGLAVMAGLSTFACPDCIAGNPLKVGVEGRARFFPSESISLVSPAFGFEETGSTGRTTDYSVLFVISVPIEIIPW